MVSDFGFRSSRRWGIVVGSLVVAEAPSTVTGSTGPTAAAAVVGKAVDGMMVLRRRPVWPTRVAEEAVPGIKGQVVRAVSASWPLTFPLG